MILIVADRRRPSPAGGCQEGCVLPWRRGPWPGGEGAVGPPGGGGGTQVRFGDPLPNGCVGWKW